MTEAIQILTINEFGRTRTKELHKFFFEQSKMKLLSQFENMEEDARKYQEQWLKEKDSFYSAGHDPADLFEKAQDEAIDFYMKLKELRNNTYLSTLSALYFDWDKTVRNTLIQDLERAIQLPRKTQIAIWEKGFDEIMNLFIGLGWNIKSENCYPELKKYSTVVNVFKHGYGGSFKKLKNDYPEFIWSDFKLFDIDFAKYSDLLLSDENLQEFSDTVISFWTAMPESFLITEESESNLPDWFLRPFEQKQE